MCRHPPRSNLTNHSFPTRRSSDLEDLGRIRRRNGAHRWTLQQDVDDPGRWVERFHSLTWIDHLRRQTRHTRADQTVLDRVAALRDEPVVVNRMLERGISTALIAPPIDGAAGL